MVMLPPIMPTLEENSEDSANVRSIAERIGDCKSDGTANSRL